jgi:hypothetical protein
MHTINELMSRLDDPVSLTIVRRQIANLMLGYLHSLQKTPRHWERAHLGHAVAALGMNIQSIGQPSHAWLRLCLIDLAKAIEYVQPDTPYREHDRNCDVVTIEELITSIEAMEDVA